MIYQFVILTPENDDFSREVEMHGRQTFTEFHEAIRSNCGYRSDEMASFYLCDKNWEKEQELTLFELGENPELNLSMDQAIESLILEKKQKLMYIYDLFNERGFFIEVVDILPDDSSKQFPNWLTSEGSAPNQFEAFSFGDEEFEDEFDFEDELSEEDEFGD
jgi:hypothetical protein